MHLWRTSTIHIPRSYYGVAHVMHENYVVIIHGTGGARALASVEVVSKQGNFIVEYY